MFNFFVVPKDNFMKKVFWTIFVCFLFACAPLMAQQPNEFYEDILVSGAVKESQQEDSLAAQRKAAAAEAARLLEQQPAKLVIPDLPRRTPRTPNSQPVPPTSVQTSAPKANPAQNADAPFGLVWGASILDIRNLGVTLLPIEEKDYVNSFSAEHLTKSAAGFRQIDLSFGIENQLWRIIAYGDLLNDTPDAAEVLRQYRRYYKLLEYKYGNARQFYTPRPIEEVNLKKAQPQTEEKIGGKNFLADLQSGEAVLYATFEGNNVGAALSVNVDGEGKSYIIIDYKNLKILREREQKALEAL